MSPDPLLMSADIARVAAERPELDEDLVQALYQHLVLVQGRQPMVDELREYVDRVSSLDQDTLRQRLGLEPRRARGRRPRSVERRPDPGATPPASRLVSSRSAARRPGRPGWTPELFWTHYRDALGRSDPPHTNAAIATHLEMLDGEMGTEPDYLRKLIRRYGLPPT